MSPVAVAQRVTPDKLLLALVLITIVVLVFHERLLEVRLDISPDDNALRFELDSDVRDGGNTRTEWIDRSRLSWRCELGDGYPHPFCGLQIHFADSHTDGIDLSRFHRFNLWLDYAGEGKGVRIFLRNANPAYTRADDPGSTKFNMVELDVRQGPEYQRVDFDYFRVADWWLLLNPLDMQLTNPEFSNVALIEIQSGSGLKAGEHVFTLQRMELVGTRISAENLYLGIIVLWIVAILLHLALRIWTLRQAVEAGKLRQAELEEINALLDQRSRILEEKIKKDPLTGAYNRAGIEGSLTEAFHNWKYKQRPLSLLLLDVDHFKRINDTHGHAVGDEVLRELTTLVSQHIRIDDHFARWGGEEFILVCGTTGLEQARDMAQELCALVSRHRFAGKHQVTVSIGVAQLQPGESLEALFERTDKALYQAKDEGRNRVHAG